MKKTFMGILIFILLLGSSCQKVKVNESDYDFSLIAGINQYSTVMSSVPGFPLQYTCKRNNEKVELALVFECDYGQFLQWNNDSVVTEAGKVYAEKFENSVIFWSPLSDGKFSNKEQIIISVNIIDELTKKNVNKLKYLIVKDENNFYFMNSTKD
ncbi:MAG: hypothetical protein JXQ23_13195 [Clostridia bacterium]|nr:hypothetical protein [Clostridia bacterium]